MPWREGAEVVKAGREKIQRAEYWQMYCAMYPRMTEDTFISFEEWYSELKTETKPEKMNVEDVLSKVNNIISMTVGEEDGITV